MKILSVDQIRNLDTKTIELAEMRSLDLMEAAGQSFVNWFEQVYSPDDGVVNIFVGPGNNGGDGLVIGRLLSKKFFEINIWICHLKDKFSQDFKANQAALPASGELEVRSIKDGNVYPVFEEPGIIIDAILGTGITKPIEGYWAGLIDHLNKDLSERVSVDIPSGMFADSAGSKTIFRADCTFTFEIPKFSFLLPSNIPYVGKLVFGQIGLNHQILQESSTDKYLLTQYQIASILKDRPETGHKGTFGHVLLAMGSYGKMGAAILAARASLRVGAGLVTTHIPKTGNAIMQIAFPEAMVSVDKNELLISEFPSVEKYDAVGIGCGIGTDEQTEKALVDFLTSYKLPVILDADALNIIGKHEKYFSLIPMGSILTPHPREFERLFGKSENDYARIELLQQKAIELKVFILLKGSRSCLATPNGNLFFNSTGNSGMATAGSGDVLSGIITGLVAQGYNAQEASLLGMYLHGMAGDISAQEGVGEEAMIASDIIDNIGESFKVLNNVF